MMYSDLRSPKLASRIAEELEERIVDGELRPGERLPGETDLGVLFGVSRTAVRDAVRTLAARGLIAVRQGHGMVVTEPNDLAFGDSLVVMLSRSDLTMAEVTAARAAIETELIPLAAERATPDDWRRMETDLAAFDEALDRGRWEDARDAHLSFHLALFDAIHLPALSALVKPLQKVFLLSSLPPLNDRELWNMPPDAHSPIVRALRRRSARAVREALIYHFSFMSNERYAEQQAMRFRDVVRGSS